MKSMKENARDTRKTSICVNGKKLDVDIAPYESLLHVLRERLRLFGTKSGCDFGGCGACTVILNGRAVYSCMTPAAKAEGARIETIEGLSSGGKLHPLQEKFVEYHAVQCGFCTPGIIMSLKALIDKDANPSEDEIRTALAYNMCRCTGYTKILEAALEVVRQRHRRPAGTGLLSKTNQAK